MMQRQLTYVPATEISMQLGYQLTLAQFSYLVDTLCSILNDMGGVSATADYDGVAWINISFPMAEDEWKRTGPTQQLDQLVEEEYIRLWNIRHFERIQGPHKT